MLGANGPKDNSLVRDPVGFADGAVVGSHADSGQFPAAKVFVVNIVGYFLKVRHVGSDQHVPQSDEIAVLHVFDWSGKQQKKTKQNKTKIIIITVQRGLPGKALCDQSYLQRRPRDSVVRESSGRRLR